MGRVLVLPLMKPRFPSRHQGLRKLSPDLISKARDDTATQVIRVGLTFLGTAALCLLSLLTPDSALLGGNAKITVPFAGSVSFSGFMLLGPAVLIVLRGFLQIFVEHSGRLDRLARSVPSMRAPTVLPLQNSLIRLFSGLIFYMLLPVAILLFAWKAAVFPAWGWGLFGVAGAVIASHVLLPFSWFSWRSKGLLSLSAGIITGGVMLSFEPLHRPFDLLRANLSGQWLPAADLRNANLHRANLSNANLIFANLSGAYLGDANLTGANLTYTALRAADLSNAGLRGADLTNAVLSRASLSFAKLCGANLSGASLTRAYLNFASLSGADLTYAYLTGVDLSDARLRGADLRHADLSGADLSGADLSDADLSGARLLGANLSDANLSFAKNLTQTQLDEVCRHANTTLPAGLTLKACERPVGSGH
jgi:uncharacterized protein YjbI with pentapeptide repeats